MHEECAKKGLPLQLHRLQGLAYAGPCFLLYRKDRVALKRESDDSYRKYRVTLKREKRVDCRLSCSLRKI